jgi:hypothetical protein
MSSSVAQFQPGHRQGDLLKLKHHFHAGGANDPGLRKPRLHWFRKSFPAGRMGGTDDRSLDQQMAGPSFPASVAGE